MKFCSISVFSLLLRVGSRPWILESFELDSRVDDSKMSIAHRNRGLAISLQPQVFESIWMPPDFPHVSLGFSGQVECDQ